MRVALVTRKVIPYHSYGGMQKYVWSLGKHLASIGIDVDIITINPGDGRYSNIKREVSQNVNFHLLDLSKWRYLHSGIQYFIFSSYVENYLRNLDVDVVHSFGIGVFSYLKSANRVPVVIQTFGNEWFYHTGIRSLIRTPLKRALSFCMSKADLIAAETDGQVSEIVELFQVSPEKVFVLPDGVELEMFEKEPKISAVSQKTTGPLILNVNRLAPNKGVIYFVGALKQIKELGYKFTAIIVGVGPEEEKIVTAIREYGLENDVIHLRNVNESELVNLYLSADLFVCPTLQEGLPLVLLDALAAGLPVVATRAAQNETIVKDRISGILVAPKNAMSIAEGIKVLLEMPINERNKFGRCGREIVGRYDWRNIAKSASQEYSALIEG